MISDFLHHNTCAITGHIFVDPVQLQPCGHLVERYALQDRATCHCGIRYTTTIPQPERGRTIQEYVGRNPDELSALYAAAQAQITVPPTRSARARAMEQVHQEDRRVIIVACIIAFALLWKFGYIRSPWI